MQRGSNGHAGAMEGSMEMGNTAWIIRYNTVESPAMDKSAFCFPVRF